MPSYFSYTPGLNNVGSYQASAQPWCSASIYVHPSGTAPVEINFPQVTKFITVKNDTGARGASPGSGAIRLAFSSLGAFGEQSGSSGNNYIVIDESSSFSADVRVTRLYLYSDNSAGQTASVIAGLTGIDAGNLPGNWTGSTGIGGI
tara:strand:- start:80 stop:520 length:441 start_codon:yes stop_codon:yes gene_type:complete